MNYLEEVISLRQLVTDINAVLAKHSIGESITLNDITVTEKTVSDLVKQNGKLSELITNALWPSVAEKTVYHYTSKEAAESILSSGIFRLANIEKRYSDGEIVTFCETHNLLGYLDKDSSGNPKFRHLIMPNTFYASFTDVNLSVEQEAYFWSTFASCNGARLKIEVKASNPNFRKMLYEAKKGEPIPLLSELIACVRNGYGREFILKGISRLCSFYLSGADYGKENEYRALYRSWDGFGPEISGAGADSYIELRLNEMSESGYLLRVTDVCANEPLNISAEYTFTRRGA